MPHDEFRFTTGKCQYTLRVYRHRFSNTLMSTFDIFDVYRLRRIALMRRFCFSLFTSACRCDSILASTADTRARHDAAGRGGGKMADDDEDSARRRGRHRIDFGTESAGLLAAYTRAPIYRFVAAPPIFPR